MRRLVKAAALLLFICLAVWAIRSETAGSGPGERKTTGGATSALAQLAAAGQGDDAWRLDEVWDDGKAEFCAYRVQWRRYGELHQGRALLVVVKEPWAPDLDVKADRQRPDGFDVLKLNHIRDVDTGIYAYHQMASAFLDRRQGDLEKLATSSTEACGITTSLLTDGRLETHSYFDGQGDRGQPFPGGLPEDALPMLLREIVKGPVPDTLDVFPSLLTGRLPSLEPTSYELRRRTISDEGAGGQPISGVELRLRNDAASHTYVFSREPPHVLLAYTGGDGTTYRLARCDRLAYWNLNGPGDEEWWPEDLR